MRGNTVVVVIMLRVHACYINNMYLYICMYVCVCVRRDGKAILVYDQVAVLARVVSQPVAATGHPDAVAAAASHHAVVEQPPVQVLVAPAIEKPAAPVAASVHAPSGRAAVQDTGEQARRRIPVPAVVRTVAPDQLVARPVAPDP